MWKVVLMDVPRYQLPKVGTPIDDHDIANKKYVDDSGGLLGETVLAIKGDSISVSWLAVLQNVKFDAYLIADSTIDPFLQWNGVVTGTYDWKHTINGSPFGTSNDIGLSMGLPSSLNFGIYGWINSVSGERPAVGGKTSALSTEMIDWMGTEDATIPVQSILIQNIDGGDFDVGSYLKVYS